MSGNYLPSFSAASLINEKCPSHGLFPDVSSVLSNTNPHPLWHPADQVIPLFGADAQHHLAQVPDESVFSGRWFHLAESVLHDYPEVFNW